VTRFPLKKQFFIAPAEAGSDFRLGYSRAGVGEEAVRRGDEREMILAADERR
jgi:hypothetical protein